MTQREEVLEQYDLKNADDLDRASAIERHAADSTINQIRSQCKPVQLPRDDGSYEFNDCEDCGNEIGEQRLRVAIQNHLCVFCASKRETINRRKNP